MTFYSISAKNEILAFTSKKLRGEHAKKLSSCAISATEANKYRAIGKKCFWVMGLI